MAVKPIIVLLAFACSMKVIAAQCIGAINSVVNTAKAAEELALAGNALAYGVPGLGFGAPYPGYGYAPSCVAPTSGGGFAVTSISPIAPTGITVYSENAIEGALAVNGQLPFLGVIALEGALPTAGAGGINYGCGSGAVGIVSEGIGPAVGPAVGPYGPIAPAGLAPGRIGYGPGIAGLGAPGLPFNGLAGPGCGYNGIF